MHSIYLDLINLTIYFLKNILSKFKSLIILINDHIYFCNII